MIRRLLFALLAAGAVAVVAPAAVTVAATKTSTNPPLKTRPKMKTAWDTLAGQAATAYTKDHFAKAVTLLRAAEIARRIYKATECDSLADKAKGVATSGTLADYNAAMADPVLKHYVGIAAADVAVAKPASAPSAWQSKDLWEPDPF